MLYFLWQAVFKWRFYTGIDRERESSNWCRAAALMPNGRGCLVDQCPFQTFQLATMFRTSRHSYVK